MGHITKNFDVSEFECPCCGMVNVSLELIDVLQFIANRVGKIKINSACRCKRHNKEVGGKSNSMHRLGIACDIIGIDCNYERLEYVIKDMFEAEKIGCYILYDTFIHIDLRREKFIQDRRG